jgi:LacI family transcriptional regulator
VPNIANPYSAVLVQSVEEKLYEEGLSLMLLSTQEQVAREISYVDVMLDKRVEGVIFEARSLYPEGPQDDSHIQRLIGEGIPVVFVQRESINATIPCVVPDFDVGCYEAIEHLRTLGKLRLAFLVGRRDHGMSSRFLKACRDVCIRLGIEMWPEHVIEGGYSLDRAYIACKTQLTGLDIDALLALNDLMAIGAIQAIQEDGRHVPNDVAIVGYGDSVHGRISTPQLTSVVDDLAKAGQVAVDLLRDMRLGTHVSTTTKICPKGLAVRGSTIVRD